MSARMRPPPRVLAPRARSSPGGARSAAWGACSRLRAALQGQGDPVGRSRCSPAPASALLAPLAGQARDRPRHRPGRPRTRSSFWTLAFVVAALRRLGRVGGADLPLGLGRAARARRPAARALRPHPDARARLLRAQPRRLADLAPDQRRRRARGSRHRRARLERAEHARCCSARRACCSTSTGAWRWRRSSCSR